MIKLKKFLHLLLIILLILPLIVQNNPVQANTTTQQLKVHLYCEAFTTNTTLSIRNQDIPNHQITSNNDTPSLSLNEPRPFYYAGFSNISKDCIRDPVLNYYESMYPNMTFDNSSFIVTYNLVNFSVFNVITFRDRSVIINEPELILGNYSIMKMNVNSTITFTTKDVGILNEGMDLIVHFSEKNKSNLLLLPGIVLIPAFALIILVVFTKRNKIF